MSTVADLIEYLKTFDKSLLVGYKCFSDACLLDLDDIKVEKRCMPRPDGWLHEKRGGIKSLKNTSYFRGTIGFEPNSSYSQ